MFKLKEGFTSSKPNIDNNLKSNTTNFNFLIPNTY